MGLVPSKFFPITDHAVQLVKQGMTTKLFSVLNAKVYRHVVYLSEIVARSNFLEILH